MLNYMWAFMILTGILYAAFTGNMSAVTNAAFDSAKEAISLCFTMAGVMALWMGLMEIAQQSGLIRRMTRGISPFLSFLFPRLPREHPARGYIATNVIANVLGLGWACTPAGLKAMEELAKLEAERGNEGYLREGAEGIAPESARGMDRSIDKRMDRENRAAIGGKGRKPQNPGRTTGNGLSIGNRHRSPVRTAGGETGNHVRVASNEMCTFLILNISSLQLIPVNMIAYRAQYGSADPARIIVPSILATAVSTLAAVVFCKVMDRRKA